jgi:mannosidase alpha-like ER degradation enhancer 2
MAAFAFREYMDRAFPKDELRPLTCDGVDTWGPYALTLVDSLDTLAVMGMQDDFEKGVRYVLEELSFDQNSTRVNAAAPVSVFETNIRMVGGMLSAHFLALDGPTKIDWYVSSYLNSSSPVCLLLKNAYDLAKRLLPAFDTPTGIPLGMVNLVHGVMPGESRVTSTAGAGTFLVEFTVLSRLTGDDSLQKAARKASKALFDARSRLSLVGNHINVDDGSWTLKDAGIGAGIDSYLEYLVKSHVLFGDRENLERFAELHTAVDKHLRRGPWYFDAHVDNGMITWPLYNSLQGFWPGLLTIVGHIKEAAETQRAFHSVWRQFGAVPEGYHVFQGAVQNGQKGYPLRPELMESAYYLYRRTRDPVYLEMGMDYVASLQLLRTSCGFSGLQDVETREKSNKMESFFLAETLKYLFLLFDVDHWFHSEQYVFNTEGHPIPFKFDAISRSWRDVRTTTTTVTSTAPATTTTTTTTTILQNPQVVVDHNKRHVLDEDEDEDDLRCIWSSSSPTATLDDNKKQHRQRHYCNETASSTTTTTAWYKRATSGRSITEVMSAGDIDLTSVMPDENHRERVVASTRDPFGGDLAERGENHRNGQL